MSESLYRKYRPKSLADVVGQEHITNTLSNALSSNQISHAYLLTGPRGVGKTSVARILAHNINKLKYDDDSQDIDIIEIDAASNRRIDEIRELREMAYMAPVSSLYKVYIIDEVHMLTKEAFNALLKILEEPPAHVIFILATTESHKLPETIISRTQRYSFKPLGLQEISNHLSKVAKLEKIKIDKPALNLIAEHSSGSLRDSLSLLDQASSYADSINEDSIVSLLGIPPKSVIKKIINLTLFESDINLLAVNLGELSEQGFQASFIAKDIIRSLRKMLIDGLDTEFNKPVIKLMRDLIETQTSFNPERYLEVALINTNLSLNLKVSTKISQQEPVAAPEPKTNPKINKKPKTEPIGQSVKTVVNKKLSIDLWPNILANLKTKHNTLYSVVRMAQPEIQGNKLILYFKFEFHISRIKEATNYKMLSETINDITGSKIEIEFIQSDVKQPKPSETPKKSINEEVDSEGLNAISSIFNGAELLES